MLSTLRNPLQKRGLSTLAAPPQVSSAFASIFNKSSMPMVPLNTPYPGVNTTGIAENRAIDDSLHITTMDNGLKVVSVDGASPMTSVGAYIQTGSRYETAENAGVNSFMESMAFKSTSNRSDFRLVREMLGMGINVTCQSGREYMSYHGDSMRDYSSEVVSSLADVIQNSQFLPSELKEAQEAYAEALPRRTGAADFQVMEAVHGAAYSHQTLGRPQYAADGTVGYFTSDMLRYHRDTMYTPQNTVIAAVGIEHAKLVELCDSSFGGWMHIPTSMSGEKSVYTGGDMRLHRSEEPLSHVALAFETADWNSPDLVPMCVLQMLMGGGGSFSAGGPGKGMYSRLYTNVLNRFGWVESITCFNSIYSDSALFGFYGMTTPDQASSLTAVMVEEAKKMCSNVNTVELSRAKNQLKSAVQMHLEQRTMRMEDIGQQLTLYGKVQTCAEICAKIDEVKAEDITRVASAMLKTNVTVVGLGDTSQMPRYDEIQNALRA